VILALSSSTDPEFGCPEVKWVLNPKDENQDNNQNIDREECVHRLK